MIVALAVALGAVLAIILYKKIVSKRGSHASATVTRDTTPAFDQFLRSSLEQLLASYVLGFANSTVHERAGIRRTLAGEPDPDVVTKIEQLVKSVELEFVRYANEPDFEQWGDRLEIFGLDLRHTPSVEAFCRELLETRDRLDFIINNACQTVRRPPDFYAHMMAGETTALGQMPEHVELLD